MNLTLREKEKLLVSLAAMVARGRPARGVRRNHPEAVALITDFVVEGRRAGLCRAGPAGGEPMILASIVILRVLVAMVARLPLVASLPMIALFGVAHGWAHGAEGPASGMAIYAAGFALVTAVLHGAGIAPGRVPDHRGLRGFGGAGSLAGLARAVA